MAQKSLLFYMDIPKSMKNEISATTNDLCAIYDIIVHAFESKYIYERAKLTGKQNSVANKNLNDIRVYSKFLSQINERIKDDFLRQYCTDTLKLIKRNNYGNPSVRKTYDTFYKWFSPDSLSGKIFLKNFSKGMNNECIDFKLAFELCETHAITENTPLFQSVINRYQVFKKAYEDLIK